MKRMPHLSPLVARFAALLALSLAISSCGLDGELPPADEEPALPQAAVTDTDGKVFMAPFETMAQEALREVASSSAEWKKVMTTAFGSGHNATEAERLRKLIMARDLSWTPAIQLVEAGALGQASGAYAASIRTVFIDRSIARDASAGRIYLEEIGHHLDTLVNSRDTAGDEGFLFAALILREPLTSTQLSAIRGINDNTTFTWKGQKLAVEHFWKTVLVCAAIPAACPAAIASDVVRKWVWPSLPTVGGLLDWASKQSYAGSAMLQGWLREGLGDGIAAAIVVRLTNNINPLVYVQQVNQVRSFAETYWRGVVDAPERIYRGSDEILHGRFKEGVADLIVGLSLAATTGKANPHLVFSSGQQVISHWQTQLGFEPIGRPLTDREAGLIKLVFAGGITTAPIVIKEGPFCGIWSLTDRAMTVDNVIYMKQSKSEVTLIHEATHVWQFQKGGANYKLDAIIAQQVQGDPEAYKWKNALNAGRGFRDFNPEQQARLIDNGFNDMLAQGQLVEDDFYGAGIAPAEASRHFIQALNIVSDNAWSTRQFRTASDVRIYRMFGDDICHLLEPQWRAQGSPAPLVVSMPAGQDSTTPHTIRDCHDIEVGSLRDGLYKAPADATVFSVRGGRACAMLGAQWMALGQPAVTVLPNEDVAGFRARYDRGAICTNADLGLWGDGLWKSTDMAAIFRLRDQSACALSWPQYVALGQPAFGALTPAEGTRFRNGFYTGWGCSNLQLGLWTDGLYKASNSPAIYRLRGQSACLLTWPQYVALGQPAFTTLTPEQDTRFQAGFSSGVVCTNAQAGVP